MDVGPTDGPVAPLLHGMPDWAYLYRTLIPGLVDAGYRCIAPDHLGFGQSDKPTDPNWYSIARHTEVLTSLVTALDDITLVCQDWGGPIGLAQAAIMPERFSRLVIMNTRLHNPDFEYSDGIKNWFAGWHPGGPSDNREPERFGQRHRSGEVARVGTSPVRSIITDLTPVEPPGIEALLDR